VLVLGARYESGVVTCKRGLVWSCFERPEEIEFWPPMWDGVRNLSMPPFRWEQRFADLPSMKIGAWVNWLGLPSMEKGKLVYRKRWARIELEERGEGENAVVESEEQPSVSSAHYTHVGDLALAEAVAKLPAQ
jgi:hypothetical protein